MSIQEILTIRRSLSAIVGGFFPLIEDGKITSGPFESQKIETVYFAERPRNRIEFSYGYGPSHIAYIFSPTILEIALLHAPVYSGQAPFFLLESHPDETFSGTWLAPHEKDALLAKWEEARQC